MGPANLKTIICATASASTIASNLSGAMVCKKIISDETPGDLPSLTFITTFAGAACWFLYGIAIADKSTMYVNAVGALLQLSYAGIYVYYSMRKKNVIKMLGGAVMGLLIVSAYVYKEQNLDRRKLIVGIISATVTILTFSVPMLKLKSIMRERSTRSLPFPIIFMNFVTSSQWLIYGILIRDPFMMVVNVLGTLLSMAQLSFFVIYKEERGGEVTAAPAEETPGAPA